MKIANLKWVYTAYKKVIGCKKDTFHFWIGFLIFVTRFYFYEIKSLFVKNDDSIIMNSVYFKDLERKILNH